MTENQSGTSNGPEPYRPGYQQPSYEQPSYAQPTYEQPYQQPYAQPGTDRVTFTEQPTVAQTPPPAPPAPQSVQSKPRRRPALMIASLAVAALVGAGAGVGSYAYLDLTGNAGAPINVTTQAPAQQPKVDGSIEAAAKVIEPSVVTITVQAGNSGGVGSGVVLDKRGHILTNAHVVSAGSSQGAVPGSFGGQQSDPQITVTFKDGRTAPATVVGTDETDDLAVIKVSGVDNLTPATFAKSASINVGQSVVAVGAPLGLSQTVTSGIVSNTARPVRSGESNDAVYQAVQTDAAVNPGNSGGPLVDLNGSVVGINSSIASTAETQGEQSGNIGIGFAIPADVAVRVSSQLIETGKSTDAKLGVTTAGTDQGDLGSTTTGVELQDVEAGGPAARAGLRAGDVITELNGFQVTTTDGLIAAIHYYAPGTKVTVGYLRNDQEHDTEATLGTM